MRLVVKTAAALAFTLALLLAAGCGGAGKESSAPESASPPPAGSSLPPESLEMEGDHDHTGLPGLDLPESLPVGDYAFEAYDSSLVQVASVEAVLDGAPLDAIVLTVPLGMKNFVECYAGGVVVAMDRLEEEGEGTYVSAPVGTLAGDDRWEAEEHSLSAGDRYDLTFGEEGFFRLSIKDSSGAVDAYYFMVAK